jgi:hypothetical protein
MFTALHILAFLVTSNLNLTKFILFITSENTIHNLKRKLIPAEFKH